MMLLVLVGSILLWTFGIVALLISVMILGTHLVVRLGYWLTGRNRDK